MWKPIKDWPTLTELFFGKGVNPATYAPSYLSGKGKKPKVKWTSKKGIGIEDVKDDMTADKPKKKTVKKAVNKPKKRPITEVTKASSKTAEKPRGTRKDFGMQKQMKALKKQKVKKDPDLPFEGPR